MALPRLVELFEGLATVSLQLFEGFLIQILQQCADALIDLGQRKKAVVAVTSQDPTFHVLHLHLLFGL